MKKPAQHLIAEVPRRQTKIEMTIDTDLGDVWTHYCTLNNEGMVVDRGRFRTSPKGLEKWFTNVPPERWCRLDSGDAPTPARSASLEGPKYSGFAVECRKLTRDTEVIADQLD